MLFLNGITRSIITAKVGDRPGAGKVELEAPQWDESLSDVVVKLTGNPVEVANEFKLEIPAGIRVKVATDNELKLMIADFDQKCSVKLPGDNSLYFLTEMPASWNGLEIDLGAWVEVPMNVNLWPQGARRPETVLCQSKEDRKHYKLFKYRNEIEKTEWEEAGLNFGGTFSKHSWHAFAASYPAVQALHAIPDDEGD